MRFRLSLVLCAVLALAVQPLLADSVITMHSVRDAMPGTDEGSVDETSTIWLGKNKFREDAPNETVIVNLDRQKIFIVKHATESYNVLDLPIDFKKLIPEEMAPMFEQVISQLAMEVEVTPTEETRRIGEYATKKYIVKLTSAMGLEMDLQIWASTDTGLDIETYKQAFLQVASMQPSGTEWIAEVLKIDGFPVLRETTVTMAGSEMTTREELVAIENKDAPEGHYEPPAGYTEEPFDFLSAMPGR